MNKKDKKSLNEAIDNEGFDYCFCNYSSFDEIRDERFHELRKNYLDVRQALADYIELKEG